jgi:hypothetical protein
MTEKSRKLRLVAARFRGGSSMRQVRRGLRGWTNDGAPFIALSSWPEVFALLSGDVQQ